MTHISFPTAAAILLSWWILWSRVNGRPYPNSWQICYVLGHILYLVCSTGPCTDKHSLRYKIRYLKYRLSMYRCSNTLNYMLPLVVSAGGHLSFVETFSWIFISPKLKGEEDRKNVCLLSCYIMVNGAAKKDLEMAIWPCYSTIVSSGSCCALISWGIFPTIFSNIYSKLVASYDKDIEKKLAVYNCV